MGGDEKRVEEDKGTGGKMPKESSKKTERTCPYSRRAVTPPPNLVSATAPITYHGVALPPFGVHGGVWFNGGLWLHHHFKDVDFLALDLLANSFESPFLVHLPPYIPGQALPQMSPLNEKPSSIVGELSSPCPSLSSLEGDKEVQQIFGFIASDDNKNKEKVEDELTPEIANKFDDLTI